MHVVAYTFEDRAAAEDVRQELVVAFELGASDALVARVEGAEAVVAVRARDENLPIIKRILEDGGGEHVTEIPEEWAIAD
jgi:hypothetical protein